MLSQQIVNQKKKEISPLPFKGVNKLSKVEISKPVLRKNKSKPLLQEAVGSKSPFEKSKISIQKKVRITPFLKRVEEKQAKEKTAPVKTVI